MGFRRLDTLLDLSQQGYWLRLRCACGHETRQDPKLVFKLVSRRGGSAHLHRLHETMKCRKCGGKDFTARHCEGPATWSQRQVSPGSP